MLGTIGEALNKSPEEEMENKKKVVNKKSTKALSFNWRPDADANLYTPLDLAATSTPWPYSLALRAQLYSLTQQKARFGWMERDSGESVQNSRDESP